MIPPDRLGRLWLARLFLPAGILKIGGVLALLAQGAGAWSPDGRREARSRCQSGTPWA